MENQKKKTTTTLLDWHEPVTNLRFLANENRISFNSEGNIYVIDLNSKTVTKTTHVSKGSKPANGDKLDDKKTDFVRMGSDAGFVKTM